MAAEGGPRPRMLGNRYALNQVSRQGEGEFAYSRLALDWLRAARRDS